MTFVFRMAARDMRASWKRLLFFFVCVAIGVGAIVALRSVIQNVRGVLVAQARTLIAADALISTNRPWDDHTQATIARRLAGAPVLARTDAIETATMVRPAAGGKTVAKIVELRAVEAAFPFYGTVVLAGGQPYSHRLLEGRGVLVRPELLTQLGVRVGDAIVIGREHFTIRGVIQTEPGRRIGAFSFGPRVLIDFDDLRATGLLRFGGRAQYQILLRVREDGIARLVRQLRRDFRDQFVTARSYHSTEDAVGEDLGRAENYLSLVGLVIVILGGIGVSSVTRVFVQQKLKSIAILKCVGGRTRQILAVYVVQVVALGIAGSLLGVALARGAIASIPKFQTAGSVLSDVSYGLTGAAVIQGVGIGLLVSLLFSLVPLLEVRHVKPSMLLRHEAARRRAVDWLRIATLALCAAALVGLAAWQAASWRVGIAVSLGFAGLTVVLHLAGLALVRLVAPLARTRWFPLRQAVLHLGRPGNQTRVILLAVGLGSFFIVGVRSLQANLLHEFALEVDKDAPDLFLIDIQRDQTREVSAFLSSREGEGAPGARLIPILRARITAVKGREINLEGYEDVRGKGSLAREYGVTYRDHLEPNERLLDGRFWTGSSPVPEVSIDLSIHERFKINVGDLIRFDILGRLLDARVTSVRAVNWKDSRRGGFMFVFRPGVLDEAPQTYFLPLRGPAEVNARAQLQHDLVERFPNVSAIDLIEVLDSLRGIVGKVTLAITVVGALMLLSGGLILVGAVAMTKFQRIYEAAIFKTLGASTRVISSMLVLEYGVLGTLAGAIGSLGALALSWGVSRYALDIAWRPAAAENLTGIVVTGILVTAIGVASSLDVLWRKPLATLRAE